MSFQNILRKRENPERKNMNFANRPTEQNLQTRPRMMTPHDEKNAPKIKSGTPGIVLIGSGIKVRGTFEACDIAEIHAVDTTTATAVAADTSDVDTANTSADDTANISAVEPKHV